ncbi:MAG: TRAP transporter substrate-binding protein [Reyranellales bacterium]
MTQSSPIHTRRHFTRLLAAFPIVLSTRPLAAQTAPWSMATEYPASTMSGEGIALFAARLAQESGGRLAVTPSYDAALKLKSADIVAAIRDGKIAAGDSFGGALGKIDPLLLLSSLPFVTATERDSSRLLDAARGLYARRFARERQRLLYAAPWPPSGLWAKKPIATPADLAGLRLRVYDATSLAVFTAAGAQAANLSFADVMPRIVDGSIEAVLSSGDGGAGKKLWEYMPYFTEIGYAVPLSFATLGQPLYEGLTPELRGAVDRVAATTQAQLWTVLTRHLDDNAARLKKNGVTLTTADKVSPELRAVLAKAASGAIDAWKHNAGPEAAAILDGFRR